MRTVREKFQVARFTLLIVMPFLMLGWSSKTSWALPTNKQLTIGISSEFETLNATIAQTAAALYIYDLAGRTLTSINADWQWHCHLCKVMPSFDNGLVKIVEKKGEKKLVAQWEIIKDARWGDGTPVTAYDMQLAWEVGKSANVVTGEKEQYEQVEAFIIDPKNPKKFTIVYDRPRYDYYEFATFYLLPNHIERPIWEKTKNSLGAYEKQTAYSSNPTNPGLYHGPYVIKEVKLGSHVVLERNPYFYGKPAKIDKIIVRIIRNTQALEANLLSGTIDMVGELGITFDQALALEKRIEKDRKLQNRFQIKYRQGMVYEHIDLNLNNPILKDIRVRRALVYAVDREKLVQALFAGKQPVAMHNTHPLDPYYTSDVMKYPYDPKKAAQLLDAAGWKLGKNKMREKAGQPLSLTLMTTAENKTRELVQVFLQNEWKKVGIEIKLKNEPPRVFLGETLTKRKFPAMAMYANISSPGNLPDSILHSKSIPTKENGYSGQNFSGYRNRATDAAFDKVRTEFDPSKRKALMKIVQQEYTKNLPVIPLYYRAQLAVIPANLKGFRITGHQFDSAQAAEDWYLQ